MSHQLPDRDHRPVQRAARAAMEAIDEDEDDVWSDVPWPVASGELRNRQTPPPAPAQRMSDVDRIRRVI